MSKKLKKKDLNFGRWQVRFSRGRSIILNEVEKDEVRDAACKEHFKFCTKDNCRPLHFDYLDEAKSVEFKSKKSFSCPKEPKAVPGQAQDQPF